MSIPLFPSDNAEIRLIRMHQGIHISVRGFLDRETGECEILVSRLLPANVVAEALHHFCRDGEAVMEIAGKAEVAIREFPRGRVTITIGDRTVFIIDTSRTSDDSLSAALAAC